MERTDVVIAGVNKAGTTSLYVSLSEHPDVAPSAIKETKYFLPVRYGRPLQPRAVWDEYFDGRPEPVRLEATPSYFYGGAAVAREMQRVLVNPQIVLVLREPVARAISFFEYQKTRLRFPVETTIEEYLDQADGLRDADFGDPDNEKFMAVRGGFYADWLPAWWEEFGPARVHLVWFEDLLRDGPGVLADVATRVGLDPGGLPAELRSENRTTAFRNPKLQSLALWFNDGSERWLRRVPGVKRAVRAAYFKINGRPAEKPAVGDATRAALAERFVEPNQRLAELLDDAGIPRPAWLI